ncbi:MAG: hypothetical protein AB8G96_04690 [Phycisphaerales bacterium]
MSTRSIEPSPCRVTRGATRGIARGTHVLAAITITAIPAVALAGDCEPTWDPTFGQPGITSGIVFDHASLGGDLYASGNFTSIGGVAANRIARWDGVAWSALGTGLDAAECYAIESYGGDLYAAGYFNVAGGVPGTAKIARWDGTAWNALDAQLELFSNQLWDMTTWDDGGGEALYVVGNYQNAGGVAGANFVSRWDGTAFTPVGGSIGGAVPLIVFTAHVWDDGDGEALYIGGRFLNVGGTAASRIAKWDGTAWSGLGAGLTGPGATPSVMAMAAFDDGTGEALYAAGQTFNDAGGVAVNRIARWDGTNWSAVGDGFDDGVVWGLQVFDDGNGPALYASGTFSASGGTPMTGLARWDGVSWENVGMTDDDTYRTLVFDDGTGDALYVAGRYSTIGGVTASGIARLQACPSTGLVGDLDGDGDVDTGDLINLLSQWGACPVAGPCPADFDGNDAVDTGDLITLLANWS